MHVVSGGVISGTQNADEVGQHKFVNMTVSRNIVRVVLKSSDYDDETDEFRLMIWS